MVRFLGALLLVASSAFAGVPAQYVVFEIDRNDAITLVSAEEVELAAMPESSVETFAATSDPRRVDVEVRDARGAAIYRESLRVDRYIRAELEGMEGRWIERERTPFVVRIPSGGETIEVSAPRSRAVSQFSVRALPSTSRAAAAATRIRGDAGNPANRLDILIMGDGYTADEASKFDGDAQRIASQFFGIVPYSSYRTFVNVTTHFVASPQSGADHPVCSDPGKATDLLEGTFKNTAFDAAYCSFSLQRLLTVNDAKVFIAAAAVPNWDMILVVVNDTMYGGAGGAVSVASTNSQAVGVAQHEFGHSFTDLADEYSSPYPGFPSCTDLASISTCEANVTDQTARASIKWGPWIASATTLPTPASFPGVGLFPGARYQSAGFYRPKNDCLMHHLGVPFCEICAQAYVLRLYNGWKAGARVDLIEGFSPSSLSVSGTAGQPITFTATVLDPDAGVARVQWYVDTFAINGATSKTFTYTPTAGTHNVQLRVTDPTTLVNPATAGSALTKTRVWTVTAAPSTAGKKRRVVK